MMLQHYSNTFAWCFLLILFTVESVNAQTCCTGAVPVTGNLTLSSFVDDRFSVEMRYDHNTIQTLILNNEVLVDDNLSRMTQSNMIQASYSPYKNFFVYSIIPYSILSETIEGPNGSSTERNAGIGDISTLVSYTFQPLQNLNFSIGGGLKWPTGTTQRRAENQIILPPTLQIGSGTIDFIAVAQVNWNPSFRKSMTFSQTISNKWNTESTQFASHDLYRFGNEFLSYSILSDQVYLAGLIQNPILMFKYQYLQKNELEGFASANSGGHWGYFIPGWGIQPSPKSLISILFEIPVFRNINGFQLTTSHRLVLMLRTQF